MKPKPPKTVHPKPVAPTPWQDAGKDLVAFASRQRRTLLYPRIFDLVGDRISAEELDIHFTHMPLRYWTRIREEEVVRHLEMVHDFLATLEAENADGTAPIVRWQHQPDRRLTQVEICTWDRLGLLAHVAHSMAATNLNIIRADVFTRADNLVLDVFEVCDEKQNHIHDEARLHNATRLLTAALQPGAPKLPPLPRPARRTRRSAHVTFDLSPHGYTVLLVEADDRIGLLRDIFAVLAAADVNVVHAIITTEAGRAGDVFYLTDSQGRQIHDALRLDQLRERLLTQLT